MPKNNFVPKIPYGTRDFLIGEAQKKRELESRVAALFLSWGYQEVVTPTFEYLDIFAGSILSEQAFKFFDRAGNVLTLRPDMTSPIARMAATRLKESSDPKRLSYIANVFRYEQAQAGRQCEFYQAGVELIGAGSAASDAEIIALAVETVKCTGLKDFRISLGHVDFINGVIENTGATEEQKAKIKALLSGRDLAGLEAYAEKIGLSASLRECLQEVLYLHGGSEIIEQAGLLANNELSKKALANLQEIYKLLEYYGVADCVDFDLGLLRNLDYYTGMIFEGYTLGLGFPICGGGRYDNMMAAFDTDCPAIGFSAGIDRILLALEKKNGIDDAAKGVYVGWQEGNFAKALALANDLRSKSNLVELGVEKETEAQAKITARGRQLLYV